MFRNMNSANSQTLEDILAVIRQKDVKSGSQAVPKHKWHEVGFDSNNMILPDVFQELIQEAEKTFCQNAQVMIDSLFYAKLPRK